jgi:glucose/arabinose dehydrogenase
VALAATLLGCVGCGGGSSKPTGLVAIGAGLRGPAGLAATVYAKGLPTMSAFALDARGRLWVTTSGATKHTDDGVYLVARAGARPVKVITGVRGPLGLTWVGNTLYVASLGRVEAYSGLRGTRFAKRRTIISEPAGHGTNNSIVRAPNGRLVMSISSACDHCTPTSRWSATIVSFRPDGSDARLYATGIRAGFGLAYYPGTSDLLVSMNQRDDLGARTPGDWLALVRQGEDWRFPGCYGQGGAACAGVPKPIAVLDKHAAAGGVAVLTGQLGPSVGTAALVSEWQHATVMRVALKKSGSTYEGVAQPFLTGLKNPLPTVATSRAVLVGDWTTGTIYRVAQR